MSSSNNGNNKEEVSCVLLGTADFKEKSAIFYLPIFFLDWIRDYLSRGFIALAFSPATTEESTPPDIATTMFVSFADFYIPSELVITCYIL